MQAELVRNWLTYKEAERKPSNSWGFPGQRSGSLSALERSSAEGWAGQSGSIGRASNCT